MGRIIATLHFRNDTVAETTLRASWIWSTSAWFAGLENIPQVPRNRAELGQNHDVRKVVSATLSVLKWGGAIFRPRSSKVSVWKVLLSPFYFKTRPTGLSLASKGLQNIPQVPVNPFEIRQNYDARKAVSSTLFSRKVNWGYISAQKLQSCALSISLKSKAIRSYFRVPLTGIHAPSSGKSSRSLSKSRCA